MNVRDETETIPWFVAPLAKGIVTFAVGWLLSVTVKLAVPPLVSVWRPEVGVTLTPAVLLLTLVRETVVPLRPL